MTTRCTAHFALVLLPTDASQQLTMSHSSDQWFRQLCRLEQWLSGTGWPGSAQFPCSNKQSLHNDTW